MSYYWMYVGDQPQLIPTMAPPNINHNVLTAPKVTEAVLANPFFQNKVFNPMALGPTPNMDLKLNWSIIPYFPEKPDTSKHFHIFVGDLCPNLDVQQMQEAFSPHGQISDCKIIQDPQTFKSKGYGFVTFVKKDDAERAIKKMNGQFIGSRAIRTNWAIRKGTSHQDGGRPFTYEDILNQTGSSNCTVYCGGIMTDLCEEAIRKTFSAFGEIVEIRTFQEKGYAFIKFVSKEDAARAIVETHLTEVSGHVVKCSWGKKAEDAQTVATPTFAHLLPHHMTPAFTFLNQPQQSFTGIPFNTAVTPQFNPLDYYVCPTDAFQKSLECATFLPPFQNPQQFSQLPVPQLLPNLTGLHPQQPTFPAPGHLYTVQ